MTDKPVNRRTFLTRAGVTALAATSLTACRSARPSNETSAEPATEEAAGLSPEQSVAPTMSDGRPALRILAVEHDGSPLSDERMKTLHARDLHNDTLPQAIVTAPGRARIELNDHEPIQLSMRLSVPGFGEVYCFADNAGQGYRKPQQIDFVTEALRTRRHRVTESYLKLRPAIGGDVELDELLIQATYFMNPSRLRENYAMLARLLHAGERLALLNARTRISRLREPRKDFLFGVMVSGYDTQGAAYQSRIRELFNFATASWYTWKGEDAPEDDRVDYARMDSSIRWCFDNKIVPKGFGYLYMTRGATQEWMRHWPYDRIKSTYQTIIRNTVRRYHPQLQHCEIMNEAHDKANLWGMTQEQILDMAKMAFSAARDASPTLKRMMNHCCLWGEYARRKHADGSRRWTPFRFIRDCFDAGIDYESIGLQLYYPQNDLFEIDRMLDRFAVFGKPCHITEIATASQDGLDPESMRPRTYAPGWHGPWTPSLQADWLEQTYTLLYSKPHFQCVGWWDFSDRPGHFWPFGGMLDANMQPKESFHRLKQLQQQWGVSKRRTT